MKIVWGYHIETVNIHNAAERIGTFIGHGWRPIGAVVKHPPKIGDNPTIDELVRSVEPPDYVVVFRNSAVKLGIKGPN